MSLLLFAKNGFGRRAPPLFEWLRPQFTLPAGIVFDPWTGRCVGTGFDTTEPTWSAIDTTVTDTGSASGNRTALQAKLDAYASAGLTAHTLITLPSGWESAGTVTYTGGHGTYYLGIAWAERETLPTPSPGTIPSYGALPRKTSTVTPAQLSAAPLFRTNGGTSPLVIAENAKGLWVRGVRFANLATHGHTLLGALVAMDGTTVESLPQRVVLSQCAFIADPTSSAELKTTRAVYANAHRVAVCDCYSEGIGILSGADTQFVLQSKGSRLKVQNNYVRNLFGPFEHVMTGGSSLSGNNRDMVPSDVEVRWNRFDCDAAFDAIYANNGKNWVEFKYVRRALVEANRGLRHPGAGGQSHGWVAKLTGQGTSENNGAPSSNACTHDVTFRFNYGQECKGVASLTGRDQYNSLIEMDPQRIEFAHNVHVAPEGSNVYGLLLGADTEYYHIVHNTLLLQRGGISLGNASDARHQLIRGNIAAVGTVTNYRTFLTRDSSADGQAVVSGYMPDSQMIDNVLAELAVPARYSGNTTVTERADLKLNPDGSLQADSPARGLVDGRDAGVCWPVFDQLHAGIV